jgi:hypothetical protein
MQLVESHCYNDKQRKHIHSLLVGWNSESKILFSSPIQRLSRYSSSKCASISYLGHKELYLALIVQTDLATHLRYLPITTHNGLYSR